MGSREELLGLTSAAPSAGVKFLAALVRCSSLCTTLRNRGEIITLGHVGGPVCVLYWIAGNKTEKTSTKHGIMLLERALFQISSSATPKLESCSRCSLGALAVIDSLLAHRPRAHFNTTPRLKFEPKYMLLKSSRDNYFS